MVETTLGNSVARGYVFDAAGRLHRVTEGSAAIAEFEYDGNSNRTVHRWMGGTTNGTVDAQDRLLTYGDFAYEYTPNGEVRSKTVAGARTTFEYDAFGNLWHVGLPSGTAIEYLIDALNRRVAKKVNGQFVAGWLYSGGSRVSAEVDASGTLISRFVYGTRANVPDYMVRAGVTYRIISNHLGSPRLVINVADGSIAQRIDYDEFGNILSDTNPGFQPFGFAGGLYDRDTRLTRFGARDYDSHKGRWMTKDPILFDASGTNVYDYALGDPINNLDPSGLDAITQDPHNLEKFYDLFEKGGFGGKQTERSAFITQPSNISGGGTANCELWPWGAGNRTEKWPAGKAWPANVVAVAHTHPTQGVDPKPSVGDIQNANNVNLPFYTVTRAGIFKYDPATGGEPTREEGPDWIGRAEEIRRNHRKERTQSCSCSQIPR